MNFSKLIRGFTVFELSWLMLCGTLYAQAAFKVSPSTLSFSDVNLGQSQTLSFNVVNVQATALQVTMKANTAFFAFGPVGQSPITCGGCPVNLALGPNETKEVQVIFPGNPRCLQVDTTITVTAGTDQSTVALSAKMICADLEFVGTGLSLSLQPPNIKATFVVVNSGTSPSIACAGEILQDGAVAQSFDIPALSTDLPTRQKDFALLIPATGGSHRIEVRIDSNNLNREAQEDGNNKRTGTITVPATITVTKSGPGTGTVIGESIDCGSDCTSSVNPGTSVTLRAKPASNSTFKNWSVGTGSATVCNSSTIFQCTFTVSQDSGVTATFDLAPPPPPPAPSPQPSPVTITVTKSGTGTGSVTGEGINCGSDCTSTVNGGTSVALSAQPASGSTFRKWSAGTGSAVVCNDSSRPLCVFTASANSRITAIFELTQ